MSRVETIGNAILYLGDCREILPTLGKVDAVVTDPPYGIGESSQKVRSRGRSSERVKRMTITNYGDFDWDDSPAPPETIAAIRACSEWQVIFGGNFFELPPTTCWLVWDKLNTGDFADCELAWTNLPKAVRRIQYLWNGCIRRERDIAREHPTQKPVEVMKWCISHLPVDAKHILDPFMGSGTTGVAAAHMGRQFTGIEKEGRYFDAACKRIEAAGKVLDLFVAPPAPATQVTFAEIWKEPYWNEDGTAPAKDTA